MPPRTALITGISGQDGSYLAERLVGEGWDVHGLVQTVDDRPWRPDGVSLHEGDLGDGDGLRRLVAAVGPEHVYNLGGITSVALSWREPERTARVTGLAALILLDAAWELQETSGHPVRFVQPSSAEIFGQPETAPQDERTPVAPVTPYGAAKAFAHHAVGVYRGRGLHASNAILYNHESPRRGEGFVTRKITMGAARVAAGDLAPLRMGNLDARRDWGWAPDYVDALVRMAAHEVAGDYVVATGTSHTVRDFVAAAFAAAGVPDWERHVVIDPAFYRPVDAAQLVGDAGRARSELGWATTKTFEEVVAAMVAADRARPGA